MKLLSINSINGQQINRQFKKMMGIESALVICLFLRNGLGEVARESLAIIPQDYKKTQLPTSSVTDFVTVGLSYTINGVYEVNLQDMSVLLGLYFRVSWIDERLLWVPGETSGDNTSIVLDPGILRYLWVPDVYVKYTRQSHVLAVLQDNQSVMMSPEKEMFVSTMLQLKLACAWNFEKFPFDVQRCMIQIDSYMYSTEQLKIKWTSLGVIVNSKIASELPGYQFTIIPQNKTICPCPGCTLAYVSCGLATMEFTRRYTAYLLSVYLPSSLFVAIAWLSFTWPPEVIPGRTVLCITSLLSVISMYGAISTNTPTTSYIKAIDVWMFGCLFVITLSLFEYAVVLKLKRMAENVKTTTVIYPMSKNGQNLQKLDLKCQLAERYSRWAANTDYVAKIALPVIFIIINIMYWPSYLA